MYEHAIPQNIMDYEFKLFAGLSLKQFVILGTAAAVSFGIFQLGNAGQFPAFFMWILIPSIMGIGLAFGLGTYNKRAFDEWLIRYFKVINSPLRRVWKKTAEPVKPKDFLNTKAPVYPQYLAVYFLNEDEFRKIMQNSNVPVQEMPASIQVTPTVQLTPTTSAQYADPSIRLPSIPNTIAFRILEDNLPVEGVTAFVKDQADNVLVALASNQDGIIYFDQSLPNGTFTFEFQSETANLPKYQILFDGTTYPLINLTESV